MTSPQTPLWIDTDPGHDDAMAILLLAKDSRVDIVGVSTVAGNATLPHTTRNATFILALAGRTDVPVYAGAALPLVREPITADVHGVSGFDGVDLPPASAVTPDEALPAIIQALETSTKPITILALGPLTNIAKVLIQRPDLSNRIRRIVIMGGAISVPGNKSRVAEFNVFCDPEAASIVFNASVPKTLVPLDPCNDVVLTDNDIAALSSGPVGSVLKRALRPYVENLSTFEGVRGALMYDPIAAYVVLNPQAFTTIPMDVRVETTSKALTYGMTVAERRAVANRKENMDVVTAVDSDTFIRAFITSITRMDHDRSSE